MTSNIFWVTQPDALLCGHPVYVFGTRTSLHGREVAKRLSNNTESEHHGGRVGRGGILSLLIFILLEILGSSVVVPTVQTSWGFYGVVVVPEVLRTAFDFLREYGV